MRRGRKNNVIRGQFNVDRRVAGAASYTAEQPRKGISWAWFIPLWGGAALLGTSYGAGWLDFLWSSDQARAESTEATAEPINFDYCHVGGGYNCVVDGGTLWLKGTKIRIADIDAPETHDYRCASEKELGDRATARLHDLLESGSITLQNIDRDEDRYGRKLRRVLVNGENVGDALVSEGLARWYGSGRRPWC